ncbi:MAG: cell division protein ZapA [Capnocytophaga sp.]|nr:cell division protein ZapA [Capnocytophaga sp.]
MDEKLRITLKIADRMYPLSIDPKKEEAYRVAAEKINEKIRFFEENYAIKDRQDALAMCAISFATIASNDVLQENTKIETTETKLEKINHLLDELLQSK